MTIFGQVPIDFNRKVAFSKFYKSFKLFYLKSAKLKLYLNCTGYASIIKLYNNYSNCYSILISHKEEILVNMKMH